MEITITFANGEQGYLKRISYGGIKGEPELEIKLPIGVLKNTTIEELESIFKGKLRYIGVTNSRQHLIYQIYR